MIFSKLENNYELQANLFSIVIHFGLFIFMLLTIQWQMKDVYYSDIELWDAMPMQIKPQPKAIKEKPIELKKEILKPAPPPKVISKNEESEIQLKKKKEAQKKEQIKKIQEQALKQEKLIELQKKLFDQEKVEKLQDRMLEQEKLEELQKKLLDQEKVEQLKKSVLDQDSKKDSRIAIEGDRDVISGSNTGELDKFKAMIQQKIHQNVNKQLCGLDPVELEFEIQLMPTGHLLRPPKMLTSSKIESCDQALERAIFQSQPLPVPKDAKLFSRLKNLKLNFQPNAYGE
ncbi:MAG: TonB C-terminal domain-containing protein [Methylophilales bacterium]|nr:TonB C-terminal domain-containing protein [Methylophilales bacterium]